MPSVRHSESRSFSLLLLSLCVLSSLVHDALAVGVTFTTPAAGATWPAGPIVSIPRELGTATQWAERLTAILNRL